MSSERSDARIRDWLNQIDARLKTIIDKTDYTDEFKAILEYALFPGGKRLRPILFLEWYGLYAPPNDDALDFACGIELMHSYSLIHDDMPCMDNDDIRRGKPTVHKRYGECNALLAGDALLNLAYRTMIASAGDVRLGLEVVSELAGGSGLIGGQYLDLNTKPATLEELVEMYIMKTGALIYIACTCGYMFAHRGEFDNAGEYYGEMRSYLKERRKYVNYPGGIVGSNGGEPPSEFGAVRRFGYAFGVAFQIYDDISEYIGGEGIGNPSILRFLELDEAKQLLNSLLDYALGGLSVIDGDTSHLSELARKLVIV